MKQLKELKKFVHGFIEKKWWEEVICVSLLLAIIALAACVVHLVMNALYLLGIL